MALGVQNSRWVIIWRPPRAVQREKRGRAAADGIPRSAIAELPRRALAPCPSPRASRAVWLCLPAPAATAQGTQVSAKAWFFLLVCEAWPGGGRCSMLSLCFTSEPVTLGGVNRNQDVDSPDRQQEEQRTEEGQDDDTTRKCSDRNIRRSRSRSRSRTKTTTTSGTRRTMTKRRTRMRTRRRRRLTLSSRIPGCRCCGHCTVRIGPSDDEVQQTADNGSPA